MTAALQLNSKWSHSNDMESFLRDLPKIELHVHLDGSFDSSLLHAHLKLSKNNECLPVEVNVPWAEETIPVRKLVEECKDIHAFRSLCCCRGKRSLLEMLKCFEIFVPIVRGDLRLLEKLSYDFVKQQASQNIIYTEVRYSPHFLAKDGGLSMSELVDADSVIDAVTRGLRQGEIDYNVKVNQIICCLTWRPEWADDVVRIARERRDSFPCAVVGIDIASGEEHFDQHKYPHLNRPHVQAFKVAQELNLNICMHAGEVGDSSNIRDAVEIYGATRIGHGYRILSDSSLIDEMKENNIHFETCPTSSVETGGWNYNEENQKDWKRHPCVDMIQNNMLVGFNSDDPSVFDTSLTWQLRIALGKMNLSIETIIKSLDDSINASFICNNDKDLLRKRLNDYCATIRLPTKIFNKISD